MNPIIVEEEIGGVLWWKILDHQGTPFWHAYFLTEGDAKIAWNLFSKGS